MVVRQWIGLVLFTSLALPSVAKPNCDLRAICYALDQSGSISDVHYSVLQRFTVGSARAFDALSRVGIRTEYSAIAFSFESVTIAPPTFELESVFVPAIHKPRKFRSSTNIYSGLRDCFEILQAAPPGARALVLVTDGAHNRGGANPIGDIHDADIAVVSVGVGSRVNATALEMYATEPRFFVPATFGNLPDLGAAVVTAACNAAEALASPEVVAPNNTDGPLILEPSQPSISTPDSLATPEPLNFPVPTFEDEHEDLLASPQPSSITDNDSLMDTLEPSIDEEPEQDVATSETPSIAETMEFNTPYHNTVPMPRTPYVSPSSTPTPPASNSKATVTPTTTSVLAVPSVPPTITPASQAALSPISPFYETPEVTVTDDPDDWITSSSTDSSPMPSYLEDNGEEPGVAASFSPDAEIMEILDVRKLPVIEASSEPLTVLASPLSDLIETSVVTGPIEPPTVAAPSYSTTDELFAETPSVTELLFVEPSPEWELADNSAFPLSGLTEAPAAAISPTSTSEPSYLNVSPSSTPVPVTPRPSPSPSEHTSPKFTTTFIPSSIIVPTTTITITMVPVIVTQLDESVDATVLRNTAPKLELRGIAASPSRGPSSSISPTSTPSVDPSGMSANTYTVMASQSGIGTSDGCERAFAACRFTFDNLPMISTIRVPWMPDASFSGTITFKPGSSHVVGAVDSGVMAAEFVYTNFSAVPITRYGRPTFMRKAVTTVPISGRRTGIAHQALLGTQVVELRQRCVRLWFERYQLFDRDANFVGSVQSTDKRDGACIVFRTS